MYLTKADWLLINFMGMFKMRKRMLLIVLVLSIIFASVFVVFALPNNQEDNSHKYDIKVGTEEWAKLTNVIDKRNACHVDEKEMQMMDTRSLVKTVVNYPLFADVYAYNSLNDGFEALSSYFAGVIELEKREDAITYLKEYASKEEERTLETDISFYNADTLINYFTYPKIEKILARRTGINHSLGNPTLDALYARVYPDEIELYTERGARFTYNYVYTPNNTPVTVYENFDWEDHYTTFTAAKAEQLYLLQVYPSANQIAPVDPEYNCHSYTWYSNSTSNHYWMDLMNAYVTDGSYVQTNASSGKKITYQFSPYSYTHSGIVIGVNGDNVTYISKWGYLGLVIGNYDDCPYYNSNILIRYLEPQT